MTIFKSQQVNLDPQPWRDSEGNRCSADEAGSTPFERFGRDAFDPRPEFEPTRDPHPWQEYENGIGAGSRYRTREAYYTGHERRFEPRREQFDTPVNRILAAFRADLATQREQFPHRDIVYLADRWAGKFGLLATKGGYPTYSGIWALMQDATRPEIDHARRVLTHLANL